MFRVEADGGFEAFGCFFYGVADESASIDKEKKRDREIVLGIIVGEWTWRGNEFGDREVRERGGGSTHGPSRYPSQPHRQQTCSQSRRYL